METTFLEDASQALKNIGSKEGVAIDVSLDNKTIFKLGAIIVITALGTVALNSFLREI